MNYDTMERLERRLGPGRPTIGGHPNGARLWRDRQRGWTIYADGFEYVNNGLLLEGIRLTEGPGPKARPAINARYGILDGARPGMSRAQVKASLRGQIGFWKGDTFFQMGRAQVNHSTNSESENLRRWIADFSFTKDRLVGIDLRAE
jgi:hypothetical protein